MQNMYRKIVDYELKNDDFFYHVYKIFNQELKKYVEHVFQKR